MNWNSTWGGRVGEEDRLERTKKTRARGKKEEREGEDRGGERGKRSPSSLSPLMSHPLSLPCSLPHPSFPFPERESAIESEGERETEYTSWYLSED
eukprot:1341016-Amorphochlora_amoeboformis.AAC.1